MENAVARLGFFDFFNHIIVGIVTILGIFTITIQFGWDISENVFSYLVSTPEISTLFLVLCIVSIIALAYILGLLCHEIFSLIDDHTTADRIIKDLFDENNSCIENKKRRNRYAELAKIVFDNNGVKYDKNPEKTIGIDWNFELNNYFYAYCLYQVQVRGLNSKPEKLRDIEGLIESFCVSTILLLIALIILGFTSWTNSTIAAEWFAGEMISLPILFFLFCLYRKRTLRNRIRMIFSIYEAIYDKEREENNKKRDKR